MIPSVTHTYREPRIQTLEKLCDVTDTGIGYAQAELGKLWLFGLTENPVYAYEWYCLAELNGYKNEITPMAKWVSDNYLSTDELKDANDLISKWIPGRCKTEIHLDAAGKSSD